MSGEIHNRTSQTVYLDVYGGTADALPTAVFTAVDGTVRSLIVVKEATPPAGVAERYSAILTMADTKSDGPVKVVWNFTMSSVPVDKTDHYEVVTPYLSLEELREILPDASDSEIIAAEAAARHIINAHCGQSFGLSTKSILVEGHGDSALRLPERLIEITGLGTLTATLDPNATIIVSDGWYLKKGWANALSTIESDSAYWNGWDVDNNAAPGEPGYEKPNHGPIIHAPGVSGTPTVWRDDYPFRITGRWGWEYVPEPVREAARLLVSDYSCYEASYRDKYLESIKAADWRLQFSSRAWDFTGNVRADQLLSQYVLLNWAIF